jgi:urease accessory protein
MKITKRLISPGGLFAILTALVVIPANAHTGHGPTSGFLYGVGHPIGGMDHLLAMLAVGLWAAQIGGRALWAVPTTFICVMVLGGILGMAGVAIPFVEGGILVSVFGVGVLIAAAVRLPLAASMVIVGFFALFHGQAHGAEMPAEASGLLYSLGFVISTAFLHATGAAAGIVMGKFSAPSITRLVGAAVCVAAVWLWVG